MKKRLLSVILALCMLSGILAVPAATLDVYAAQSEQKPEEEESPVTGNGYRHAPHLLNGTVTRGIKVSQWQKEIDWAKIREQGVQFAFIRCGNTVYSDKFVVQEDPYFRKNMQGAYDAGIRIGVYFSSNATLVSEVEEEAQNVLQQLSDFKGMITLPVVYDAEILATSGRVEKLTKEQMTLHALTFLKMMKNAGYKAMYSGTPDFFDRAYDLAQMQDYPCLVIDENLQTSYTGDYTYWQYASTGRIDGLEGAAGCIFYYDNSSGQPQQSKKQTITYRSNKIKNGKVSYGASFSLNAKSSGKGKLSYKSSNTKVLTVNAKGKVTVKGYGSAVITIKAAAAAGYKAAVKKIKLTVASKK